MVEVHNETVSSFTDFITKASAWMETRGWEEEHLDVTATASTGGEWAMKRANGPTNLRFAASWDGAGTPNNLAIYHYVDQNYVVGDRPWGQDHDSGNGFAATTPDASIVDERHVIIGSSPIEFFGFDGIGKNQAYFTYIVVRTADDVYCHLGFGVLDKQGSDWEGGEFVFGQRNNLSNIGGVVNNLDGMSFLLDGFFNDTADAGGPSNGAELMAATIHVEDFPNQPTDGMFAVSMGGVNNSPQTDFGTDRQSNDGSSSDIDRVLFTWGYRAGTFAHVFSRQGVEPLTGEMRFWSVATTYVDSNGDVHGYPLAFMPEVFGCSMERFAPGDILTDDIGDEYHIFPAHSKWPGSGSNVGRSGYLGIAYRVAEYVDPGLPESLPAPTGWWSSRSSDDYTVSGIEVTTLNDKSANGNDFTVPGGETGPDILDIGGRNWMTAPVADPRLLVSTNTDVDPDDDSFTFIIVYRATTGVSGGLFGKRGPGNENYGNFVAVSNARSLYFQCRDSVLTNDAILEHDDAGTDYTDNTRRMTCAMYDTSVSDVFLFGDDFSDGADVASDLSYTAGLITPGNNLYMFDWDNNGNNLLEGEIAEVVCFGAALTNAQRGDIESYLREKWDIF